MIVLSFSSSEWKGARIYVLFAFLPLRMDKVDCPYCSYFPVIVHTFIQHVCTTSNAFSEINVGFKIKGFRVKTNVVI